MFKSIRNDEGEVSWKECCDLYERLEERMTPWIMLHFDVHENYTKYLKDAMAKAMSARHTHLRRSKELSEITYGGKVFKVPVF